MCNGRNGRGQVRAGGPPPLPSVCPGNSTFVTYVTDVDRSERVLPPTRRPLLRSCYPEATPCCGHAFSRQPSLTQCFTLAHAMRQPSPETPAWQEPDPRMSLRRGLRAPRGLSTGGQGCAFVRGVSSLVHVGYKTYERLSPRRPHVKLVVLRLALGPKLAKNVHQPWTLAS